MQWFRLFVVASILFLGLLLATGNVWFAAARSTISIALEGTVTGKQIRFEHTPGADDVHFLIFDNGRRLHVDAHVYEAIRPPARLSKEAWSRTLRHGDEKLELKWSLEADADRHAAGGRHDRCGGLDTCARGDRGQQLKRASRAYPTKPRMDKQRWP